MSGLWLWFWLCAFAFEFIYYPIKEGRKRGLGYFGFWRNWWSEVVAEHRAANARIRVIKQNTAILRAKTAELQEALDEERHERPA